MGFLEKRKMEALLRDTPLVVVPAGMECHKERDIPVVEAPAFLPCLEVGHSDHFLLRSVQVVQGGEGVAFVDNEVEEVLYNGHAGHRCKNEGVEEERVLKTAVVHEGLHALLVEDDMLLYREVAVDDKKKTHARTASEVRGEETNEKLLSS